MPIGITLHPSRPFMMLTGVPDGPAVLRTIRPSKVIERHGDLHIVALHNSDTVRVASNLGITVPSTIRTRYTWPGRFKPYAHQITASDFLTQHNRCLNLSDMGTGKTASALWAADHLMQEGLIRKVLIVAPLSCLSPVWEREIFQVTPHRTATILHAARARRKHLATHSRTDYMVINHDGLGVVLDDLMQRTDLDLIIYDEASALKNGQTIRFKQMTKLLRATCARVWLLTGTPTPNAPTDAWALGRIVNPYNSETNPQGAPGSFIRFRDMTMRKHGPFKWMPKINAQTVVRTVLQPAVRFKKEDCLDLPPITYSDRFAELSKEQEKAFSEMRSTLIAQAKTEHGEGLVINAINAAAKLSKLLQICSGAVYAADGRIGTLNMSNRLNVLVELIEQASKKTLVFVPFRHALNRVHNHLISLGVTTCVMHGGVTGQARSMMLKRFMDDDNPKVLVAHPRTASHGLNLICAANAVWFGPSFSAEGYQQANERMARPGQDTHMSIVHLSSCQLEQKIFRQLEERQVSQRGLLALYEEEILST